MKRFGPRSVVLLCLALIAMRAAGVHLHLCLDGQEASQQLHWSDAGVHSDDSHTSGDHSDVDLNLSAEGLLKVAKAGFDLPVLLFAVLGLFALCFTHRPFPFASQRVGVTSWRYFQPPSHAPPR